MSMAMGEDKLKTLGRVDEPQPEACSGQLDEGEETLGGLVVARRHRPELLEPAHQPLDPVAQPVQLAVDRRRLRAHRAGGITGRIPRSSDSSRVQSAS
jgi:hypothetical protein